MTSRIVAALLVAAPLLAGALAGCSDEPEPVLAPPLDQVAEVEPAYDAALEPAAAALALVPTSATELVVTDFAQLRLELGVGELDSSAPRAQRDDFWRQVADRSPALDPGLLRPDDARLLADYGFTQDDVEWQAQFSGPDGDGYALKLRDDLRVAGVKQAVDDGVGALAGSTFYSVTQLVVSGITLDPTQSWVAEPELTELVGPVAGATYVTRECVPLDVALGPAFDGRISTATDARLDALDDLGPWSVSFGSQLVTAHLGPDRPDTFDRARIAGTLPESATGTTLEQAYAAPVADPRTGRIGFDLADPAVAAELALDRRLPFAVCAP